MTARELAIDALAVAGLAAATAGVYLAWGLAYGLIFGGLAAVALAANAARLTNVSDHSTGAG